MTHELHFPPCSHDPPHPLHPPPYDKPLRVYAFAPLSAIEKLLPDLTWDLRIPAGHETVQFQQCAKLLATLVHRKIYGVMPQIQDDIVLCCETIGRTNPDKPKDEVIYRGKVKGMDTYAIIFDHLVPANDQNPETLQIMIFETEYDDAAFAKGVYRVPMDWNNYAPYRNRICATYGCCTNFSGRNERERINFDVMMWETPFEDMDEAFCAKHGITIETEYTNAK